MCDAPKEIVEKSYDEIADWYLGWVEGQRSPRERYASKVLENGPPAPRILELGCGPGVPVMRMLLDRGAEVVANDISAKQLSLAKSRCPQATLIPGDMAELSFEPASFDGVICLYTMFHLPRAEQKSLLSKTHSWLKPSAMFVFNLVTVDDEEIYGEFLGRGMFWSSYGVEDGMAMVRNVGLEVVQGEMLEAGDGKLEEGDPDHGAELMWVVTRKGLGE